MTILTSCGSTLKTKTPIPSCKLGDKDLNFVTQPI